MSYEVSSYTEDPEFKSWWVSRLYISVTFIMMITWLIYDRTAGKLSFVCDPHLKKEGIDCVQ